MQELERESDNIADLIKVSIGKDGCLEMFKDKKSLKEYFLSIDSFDPNSKINLESYQIADFLNTSDRAIASTNKAKHTFDVLQQVFDFDAQPRMENPASKKAITTFEDFFKISNEKYSALSYMTFSVVYTKKGIETPVSSLNLYYPVIRKAFKKVELIRNKQSFTIPAYARALDVHRSYQWGYTHSSNRRN